MQFKNLCLPLVFILRIGISRAASSSCSFSTTMDSASDVASLSSCTTLSGDIEITGDDISSVDLSSVQEIKADLRFFNSSSITEINLNQLSDISGSLSVEALTQLHNIDFSSLTNVNELTMISLPSLATLNLNKGISEANSIELSDTAMSTLQGLIGYDTVGTLNINNNKNITSIDLTGLESVSDGLILSFNGDDVDVKLDDLKWAANLTLQDIATLSLDSLTNVNGSVSIAYNSFESLNLTELEEVDGSLQIFANLELTELDLQGLETVGGELRMYNNTNLDDLSETFENLETVKGAVNINGPIQNFSLPSLDKVDGTFTFISTSDDISCKDLNSLKKKVAGHNFSCSAKQKKSSSKSKSSSSSSSGSSTASSASSSSKGSSSSSSSSKKSDGAATYGYRFTLSAMLCSLLTLII